MRLSFFAILLLLFYACDQKKETSKNGQIAESIYPEKKNNTYNFTFANVYFEVDTFAGGRISSLKLDGDELLYVSKDSSNNNWGSTFWPSPQNLWGWPPPVILDNHPYHSLLKADTLVLHSEEAPLPKISVGKAFNVSEKDSSINIVYSMYNPGDSAVKASAWEITRVPSGGLIFFPNGSDQLRGDLKPLTKDSLHVVWLDYDSANIPAGVPKLFADGTEGWIAYVNNSRQLFIKKFTDSPLGLKAPDPENEIEIYTDPANRYTEVEQQGPYTTIEPKTSISWTVKWYVRSLPDNVQVQLGSPSLLKYIRSIVNN